MSRYSLITARNAEKLYRSTFNGQVWKKVQKADYTKYNIR